MSYKALVAKTENGKFNIKIENIQAPNLEENDVLIKSHYSSLNYKDALAVTNSAPILKSWPLTPGIDVSGIVLESKSTNFKKGDHVLITGTNLGETDNGGYSEIVKSKASRVISLPEGLSLKEAMILGTAGFTAALCLYRMEQMGQSPEMGTILVTGATGGVGSFSINLLSQRGYNVAALTGKLEMVEYLKSLGANEIISTLDLNLEDKPLNSTMWGGAVDSVGGKLLGQLLPYINLWGSIATVGMAGGPKFSSTVMPFILRGVSLLGISSNNTPMPIRKKIWQNLANEWKPKNLTEILTKEISLEEIIPTAHETLKRKTTGRTIIKFT